MDIQTGINIIEAIVGSSGFSALVVQGFKVLKQMGVDKKLQNVENLALKAVNAAHSVGLNLSLDDSKTYEFALNWVKNEALKHGIKYDDNSLQGFIEDAYQTLSKGWTEANAEVSTTPSNQIEPTPNNSVLYDTTTATTVTTPSITISKEMLQPTYDAILNKAEQDAKNAIDKVTNNIQQIVGTQQPQQTVEPSIPVEQVQTQPVTPVTPVVDTTQPLQEQPAPVEATPTQPQ